MSGPVVHRREIGGGNRGVRPFRSWSDIDSARTTVCEEGSRTLLDAVVDAACEAAKKRGSRARTLWLPPLPESVELAGVVEPMGFLRAAVGVIDRPYHQRQDPLVLDFTVGGGHVALCGGPRSGKSTALGSIVASLAATHTTSQVRFYVVDMAGDSHSVLGRLPHVAGVAGRKDLGRVHRIFDEVTALMEAGEPDDGRHTFVVIDGWHALVADCEEEVERVARLVADGAAAGIHVMISTQRWTVLRPAIRDLIDYRLELLLGEAMDSLIDRKAQQKIPARPGRGITQEGEQMLWCMCSPQDIAHITTAAADQEPVPSLKVLPSPCRCPSFPLGGGARWGSAACTWSRCTGGRTTYCVWARTARARAPRCARSWRKSAERGRSGRGSCSSITGAHTWARSRRRCWPRTAPPRPVRRRRCGTPPRPFGNAYPGLR